MKKHTPVELPFVVSVRFSAPEFQRSFRLSEDEWHMLNVRADQEHRTVSNLRRMLLRTVVQSGVSQ